MDHTAFKGSLSPSFGLTAMQHSITLADAKAAAILTASTAMTLSTMSSVMRTSLSTESLLQLIQAGLLIISIASLVVTALAAWRVIWPRLRSSTGPAPFFFGSNLYDGDAIAAASTLLKMSEADLVHSQVNHIVALGKIAREKFSALRVTFISGGASFACFLVAHIVQLTS